MAEDLNDEDDDAAEELALAEPAAPKKPSAKAASTRQSTAWVGSSSAMDGGRQMYRWGRVAAGGVQARHDYCKDCPPGVPGSQLWCIHALAAFNFSLCIWPAGLAHPPMHQL